MTSGFSVHRLLLRAELQRDRTRIVTHTIEISESLVFVQTDEIAAIGDEVLLSLSFPGLVEPFSVNTQVIARRPHGGPGQPGGWTLGFLFYRQEELVRLRRLIAHARHDTAGTAALEYRVLLVEDSVMMRQAFALGVSKYFGPSDSFVVDAVGDGHDAMDRLRERRYQLAIVDYYLPALNGGQLITALRREPDLVELPIFAISVGGAEIRREALAAGADLFVQKPIVMRDLLGTLKQLMHVRASDWHGHTGVHQSATA